MTDTESPDRRAAPGVADLSERRARRPEKTDHSAPRAAPCPGPIVSLNRHELRAILSLYGRKVAAGEWRDYAMDFTSQKAVFSIFRRASEAPMYRIEKDPALERKQGCYSVIAAGGLIMKRGNDLERVIAVLDKSVKLVAG